MGKQEFMYTSKQNLAVLKFNSLSMVLEPQIFVAEPPLCMSWMIGIVSERLKWAYVKRWRMKYATVCCSRM